MRSHLQKGKRKGTLMKCPLNLSVKGEVRKRGHLDDHPPRIAAGRWIIPAFCGTIVQDSISKHSNFC